MGNPPVLPPKPALLLIQGQKGFLADRLDAGVAQQVRPGPAGAGSAGQRLDPAAGHFAVPLHVCPQGSGAFLHDRRDLEQLGIVRELTVKRRNRLFSYAGYVEIMSRGTELPVR